MQKTGWIGYLPSDVDRQITRVRFKDSHSLASTLFNRSRFEFFPAFELRLEVIGFGKYQTCILEKQEIIILIVCNGQVHYRFYLNGLLEIFYSVKHSVDKNALPLLANGHPLNDPEMPDMFRAVLKTSLIELWHRKISARVQKWHQEYRSTMTLNKKSKLNMHPIFAIWDLCNLILSYVIPLLKI